MRRMKSIRFEIVGAEHSDLKKRTAPKGLKGDTSLMMWKELCRTGHYETDGIEHEITEEFLTHMVDTFRERIAKGVEIPCPKGHTRDPEKKRGRAVHLETRPNADGGVSLWGIIEFLNEEYKRKLEHADVSIDAPETTTDGDGAVYHFTLESLAFTDYPVVAGMEGFHDVKFSIWAEIEPGKSEKWTLDTLITRLGLAGNYSDASDIYRDIYGIFERLTGKKNDMILDPKDNDKNPKKEEKKMAKRSKKFEEAEDKKRSEDEKDEKLSKKKRFEEKETEDDKDADFENEEDEDKDFEDEDEEEFEDDDEEDEKDENGEKFSKRKKFSRMGSILRENRELRINDMRRKGLITAEQSNLMKREYCSDRSISFSLESNRGDAEFNRACKLMSAGKGRDYSEKSGPQFSRNNQGGNALDAVMEKRFGKK